MKTINRDDFFKSYAFVVTMKKLMADANVFEKLLEGIYGQNSPVIDMVYDTNSITMDEFTTLLSKQGITIDWSGNLLDEIERNENNKKERLPA